MSEFRRKIDPMNRVTIPVDICDALRLRAGDYVLISSHGGVISIKPAAETCMRCGAAGSDLNPVEDGTPSSMLCTECLEIIYSKARLFGTAKEVVFKEGEVIHSVSLRLLKND